MWKIDYIVSFAFAKQNTEKCFWSTQQLNIYFKKINSTKILKISFNLDAQF